MVRLISYARVSHIIHITLYTIYQIWHALYVQEDIISIYMIS
jgi:hypothetical protein